MGEGDNLASIMTTTLRSIAAVVAPMIVFVSLGFVAPATAATKDAKITKVTRGGSSVSSGATVAGTVQLFVSASADLPLEFVRLEAQTGNDPLWYCLEQWVADGVQTTLTADRTWKTPNWTDPRRDECAPGTCSSCTENSDHQHGALTANGDYRLRVVARERGQSTDANDAISAAFVLRLSNAPSAPEWIGKPQSNGGSNPAVILRWSPSPQPDIVEYQFVREDPAGNERIFAVSADDPQVNGCSKAGTVAYTCPNGDIPRSGVYQYALRALRAGSGGGAKCATTGASCVASGIGKVQSVSVTVAAASSARPTATSPALATNGATPHATAPAATQPQEPVAVPDLDSGDDLIEPHATAADADDRPMPAVIAAGVLALAAGALFARQRLRTRKTT